MKTAPSSGNHGGVLLGIDLGGSQVRVAVARHDGEVVRVSAHPVAAEAGPAGVVAAIIAHGRTLLGSDVPSAVGLGTPGLVDIDAGVVRVASNLRDWRDVPLRRMVGEGFDAPTQIENDVNLAALAEHRLGAGQDADTLVFLAVGTGVGAGVIVGGRLHRGARLAAGEVNTLPSGVRSDDGARELGVEEVASGPAIVRRALARGGVVGWTMPTTAALFDASSLGVPVARSVVNDAVSALVRTVVSFSVVLDPDLIVIGGGVAQQGDVLLGRVREQARILRVRVPIGASQLGDAAQLRGALLLAGDAAREAGR